MISLHHAPTIFSYIWHGAQCDAIIARISFAMDFCFGIGFRLVSSHCHCECEYVVLVGRHWRNHFWNKLSFETQLAWHVCTQWKFDLFMDPFTRDYDDWYCSVCSVYCILALTDDYILCESHRLDVGNWYFMLFSVGYQRPNSCIN